MAKYQKPTIFMLFLFLMILIIAACSDDEQKEDSSDIWDIDEEGIPRFVATNYIELDQIYRISKYRSSIGHDYSDAYEDCRSMKHYFEPKGDAEWSTIKIYAPVTGSITRIEQEWAGTRIEIVSDNYPAFRFSIFHINLLRLLSINDKVLAGEQLGTHIGSQTMSDISVIVNDPARQGRIVSYIETITDAVFKEYSDRGVETRESLIISKEIRDANPLSCNGELFISEDTLENWVILN